MLRGFAYLVITAADAAERFRSNAQVTGDLL